MPLRSIKNMKTVIQNAKIYCNNEFFRSILIQDNNILRLSKEDIIDSNDLNDAMIIDAKGKLVLPGLHDSHLHFYSYGKMMKQLQLHCMKSIEEIIQTGKKFLDTNSKLNILIADGYNQDKILEKRMLTKDDLNQISTEIPLVFYRICGHKVICNSKALELAKIDVNTKVEGGEVEIDQFGNVTGILSENAIGLLNSLFPKDKIVDIEETLICAMDYASSHGLTSIQTNDFHVSSSAAMRIYQAYQNLKEKGKLNLRIHFQTGADHVNDYLSFLENVNQDNFIQMYAIKLFLDGSLGAKTAALIEGYLDDKHNHGILCIPNEELTKFVLEANEHQIPVIIHAIGDQAIQMCIDTFRYAKDKLHGKYRNGIVHCQITNPTLIEEIKKLKIDIYAQPIFLDYDMSIVYHRVEKDLADTSYAFSTLNHATTLSMGTDAPVEDLNPFPNIYCAVTRKNLTGTRIYNENEAMSVKEAVDAYTIQSAKMVGRNEHLGQIKENYLADLIIVDDIFLMKQEELKDARVYLTMVDGKVIFRNGV